MKEQRIGKPDLDEHKSFVKFGMEALSKDWYDKGADLEGDHPVGAMNPFAEQDAQISTLPKELQDRLGYDCYGGDEQFYIKGVDGTLAQLGQTLPAVDKLPGIIKEADALHKRLLQR